MSWIYDSTLEAQEKRMSTPGNTPQLVAPPADAPVLHEFRPWLVPAGRIGLPVFTFVLLLYVFWNQPMIGALSTILISTTYEVLGEARLRRYTLRKSISVTPGTTHGKLNRLQLIRLVIAQPELAWATYLAPPTQYYRDAAPGLPIIAYLLWVGTIIATSWTRTPKDIPLSLAFLAVFVIVGTLLFVRIRRVYQRSAIYRIEKDRGVLAHNDSSEEIPLSDFKTATLKWDPGIGQEYLLLHRDGVDYPLQSQAWDPLELLRQAKQTMPSLEIRANDFP